MFEDKRRSALFLGIALIALTGCATSGSGSPDVARALRARGLDPSSVVIPYEISEEMREWVHRAVPAEVQTEKRLDRLLDAIVGPSLGIRYEARYTGTAQEVFKSRKANCLAFTSLFVGLAREIGLPVLYLDVDDIEKFEKEGDLVVVSGHVSAGHDSGAAMRILDFSAAPPAEYRKVSPMSDLTAIALFHSNRGAELLRVGKNREALDWLRKAVAIDPELGRAWVNYGVALRRAGDTAGAEAAYRKGLEADPAALSAYQNLAALLRLRGQEKEAEDLLAISSRLGSRNPFLYISLGDLSLVHGRTEEARRFYRKALRLVGKSAEPYAAMGLLSLSKGDTGEARKWLRKAAAIDRENQRVKQLAGKLAGEG